MEPLDVIALAGEVVAWIALTSGLALLLAFAFARMADGTWDPTEVAILQRPDGDLVRWFAGGEFHERPLEAHEHARHGDEGELVGWVRRRTPERLRFEASSHVPRVLGTLAVILLVVGVAATVASTVAGAVA
ncbi:hypothetical protein [Agromyces marinus]|uniref:Sortase n=1 Tax=Agromyces marinus TaxID=1389020 RepID=A0ABN6YAQ1_9MICO|nr:hypothetical protein [Agromyces marinus]UIP57452.1 hypothetical protein DSM26151_03100 [Agromyces marinus]BDZ54419.1 hypothetical protein GCM10025870_14920 [Agromyces marinus]